MSLFFFFGSVGEKCVSDIVSRTVEPTFEAIDHALDDYLEAHEDNGTWYSFHEFIEDREG